MFSCIILKKVGSIKPEKKKEDKRALEEPAIHHYDESETRDLYHLHPRKWLLRVKMKSKQRFHKCVCFTFLCMAPAPVVNSQISYSPSPQDLYPKRLILTITIPRTLSLSVID